MSFYVRVFLNAGALVAVHSSGAPIAHDCLSEGIDGAIDAQLPGDYLDSGALMPLLSVVNGELMMEGNAVAGQVSSPRTFVPLPAPQSMTFAQLLIGLVDEQWISEADGDAWLQGTLPAAVVQLIDSSVPEPERFRARARALRPSVVMRNDPLVVMMASFIGKADELDAFFQTYSAA